MTSDKKQSSKLLISGFLLLSVLFPHNIANAGILPNIRSGIQDIKNVYQNLIIKIRYDFCTFYTLSISNGDWSANDLRSRIGRKFCAGYKPKPIEIDTRETITVSGAPKINVANNPVPSTSLPNPLVGDTAVAGGKLNSLEIIYWTNIERAKNGGMKALIGNGVLSSIALSRIEDMFAKSYFAHVSPSGDSAIKMAGRVGYEYITIGENIALGNFDGSRDLVNAWMNSPGHRANILNTNYTEIGVSAKEGMYQGEKVWLSAQIFGRPLSDCIQPDEALKSEISSEKASAETLNANLNTLQTELKNMSSSNTAAYNAKVAEYNNLVKIYNSVVAEIKKLTATYNQQVQIFNDCIKTI